MAGGAEPEPTLSSGQVMGWTLLGAVAGAVAGALLVVAWSEWSGAEQGLGFLGAMLDYAFVGSGAGAVAGLVWALTRRR